MEHADLVRYVATVLNELRIPYLIAGGTGSIFYGEPRFTIDIDVVVDLPLRRVEEFCSRFPEDSFYVSIPAAKQAVLSRHQFNIIHPESGLKIDVIIPGDEYEHSQFARACIERPGDFNATFASPEDIILKKLLCYKEGASEKHLRDITGIIKLCRRPLDFAYLQRLAKELDVTDIWQAILARLGMH